MIHGVYDIDGVSLSMPAIVGADGIESDIPINLSGEEALKLKESADSLKRLWRQLNYKFTHGRRKGIYLYIQWKAVMFMSWLERQNIQYLKSISLSGLH